MRVHVTYHGEGHRLTVMFSLILMTMLFHATLSTAALSSDSVTFSSCEIPEVREEVQATLTCHFENDLKSTKQGVKVVQLNSTTVALVCLWHFDKPDCIVKKDFKHNGEISNELRLDIPRVTKEHAGSYACIVFDSEPGTQSTCALTIIDSDVEKFPLSLHILEAVAIILCTAISFVVFKKEIGIFISCKYAVYHEGHSK